MASTPATSIRPGDLVHALVTHPSRFIIPVVLTTVVAVGAALLQRPAWEATQALIVRDEAAGNRLSRPGKFDRMEEMKSVQETILELAHSRGVIQQALIEVGPGADTLATAEWPTPRDVETLQDNCKITPPKGAEFGKTEVFYLKVQTPDKNRAVALAAAVSRHLQARFEELRKTRAQSVTDELLKTVSLAETDLYDSTATLSKMERSVGRDLSELRILNESPSGESDLRRMSVELESELRTQRAALNANIQLLKLLTVAQEDPGRLLASPGRLLESQPSLKRLKEGLVDAQLATAKLHGTLAADHPLLKAAKAAEQEIGQQLHDEIAIAIKGVDVDVRLTRERVCSLESQRIAVDERRERIANMRADYANLVTVTRHRTEILKTAQLELSEARATQAAAHRANLISLVDAPDPGNRPVGPGRTVIVLAGLLGGLVIGAGVIFLSLQPAPAETAADTTEVVRLTIAQARQSVKRAVDKLSRSIAL